MSLYPSHFWVKYMSKVKETMHQDFVKILRQFVKRYGQKQGTDYYYTWLNQHGLDDTVAYGSQYRDFEEEKFSWAKSHFKYIKSDKEAKYYKVEAAFPLTSMNYNVYTEDELLRAARTLVGKDVNMNHRYMRLKGVTIEDAEYEDGAVEVLLRIKKDAGKDLGMNFCSMIDAKKIIHVSIEASCKRGFKYDKDADGWQCVGLNFSGLALLTKDALPGIPLTRILPVEKLVESFNVTEFMKMKEEKTEEEKAKVKEDSKRKTKTVTGKLAKLEFQLSEVKRKYQKMKEEAELAKSHLEIKEKAYNELQVSCGEIERRAETLNAKLQQLTEIHEKALKRCSDLTADHTRLRSRYEELGQQHGKLLDESEHTQQLLSQEQKAHYDASTENLALTQQLTARNNEVLELKTQIQGLEKQLAEKTNSVLLLQKQLDDALEKLKKAKRLGRLVVKI